MSYTLSADQFVTWLSEGGGLIDFVETQLGATAYSREPLEWAEVTRRIWHCSEKVWTPSPEYVQALYEAQKAKVA